LGVLLAWNLLLTAGLAMLFLRPAADPPLQVVADTTVIAPALPEMVADEDPGISNFADFLYNARAMRSQPFRDKKYTFEVDADRGSVVTIWHNDQAVRSETVRWSGVHQYPVRLTYSENRLRIMVWDRFQDLVHHDHLTIDYQNDGMESLRYSFDRGDPNQREVSLTFDGGAGHEAAEIILDVLKENSIITTFFLTGQFVKRNPAIVLRMLHEGHEIGNHTYNHPHLTTFEQNGKHDVGDEVDRAYVQHQLLLTDSLFHGLTGQHMMPYWRAPYGEYNQEILDWAAEVGFKHIRWTRGFDTFDWVADTTSKLYRTPDEVSTAILNRDNEYQELNGAVVLMHLGSSRKTKQMHLMLPELIPELKRRGFEPVTISDLLKR
jgi:peptidoglycan/xylan/chitin deacetylase (PgdA/CDA1 family)